MVESRKHIYGLRACYFLCQCVGVSIAYFCSGFVYTFNRNLLGKYAGEPLISFANTFAYATGALLCGFFISYGRRKVLMIVNICCICVLPLLVVGNTIVNIILYMLISVINGFWVLSVFVYAKDISVVHQPAFVATFVQGINSLGVVFGRIAELSISRVSGAQRLFIIKMFIGVGIATCCLYQLITFVTYMKDEPMRYVYERYGEEPACKLIQDLISDQSSVERMLRALQKASLYRKFKGVNYMSIFSRYYRKAFTVCLCLFLFKGAHHVLSFRHRVPAEFSSIGRELGFFNAVMKVVLVFSALLVINKMSRKRLLLVGYSLYIFTHTLCTIAMPLYLLKLSPVCSYLLLISSILAELVAFSFLTYMPYVLALELLPDKGVAFMMVVYATFSSLNNFTTGFIIKAGVLKWGYYPLMVLVCAGALWFIELCMEDTKDVSEEGTRKAYLVEEDTESEFLGTLMGETEV